jgi:hypothetical protein
MTDPYRNHWCMGSFPPRAPQPRDLCRSCARYSPNSSGWFLAAAFEHGTCRNFIPLQIPKESK